MVKSDFPNTSFFLTLRRTLHIFAILLIFFHFLLAEFRFIIDYRPFMPYERWGFLTLLFLALFYLVVSFRHSDFHNHLFYPKLSLISYEQLFLISLFIWFIIVCAVRQLADHLRYLKAEDWWIMDLGISALLLFPLPTLLGIDRSLSVMNKIFQILVILYTIFSVWALCQICRTNFFPLPSGGSLEITSENTLFFGTHYNMTGAISFTIFALSFYLAFSSKSFLKIFFFIISLPHLLVLFLSNSRTSFLGVLFFFTAVIFFISLHFLHSIGISSSISCVLISLICSSVFGFFFWHLRSLSLLIFYKYIDFPRPISFTSDYHILSPLSYTSCHILQESLSTQSVIREVSTGLNGRLRIWLAAIKVMFSSPLSFIFGVTPAGIPKALIESGGLSETFAGAHNVFLHVGVSFGVPAMFGFLVFTFKIITNCFFALTNTSNISYKKDFILPLTILTLLLMNLTEDYLIACFCIQSSVFFFFSGYLTALSYSVSEK